MTGRLPLGYLITLCILAGVIVLELTPGTKATVPPVAIRLDRSMAPGQASIQAGEKPPTTLAAVILARPLFRPSRRPPAAARPSDPHEAAPRLSGVIIYGSERLAIFAGSHGGTPVVAAAGGHVGGWIVSAIEPDGVALTGHRGTRRIRPSFSSAPAAIASLPPAPTPDPTAVAMAASRHALLKLLDNGSPAAGR